MVDLGKKLSAIKIFILMILKIIVLEYSRDHEYEPDAKCTGEISSDGG